MNRYEGISIRRTPSLCNDQPYLAEGAVVRIVDIVDRVRAGDSELDVAKDFGVRGESVRLLMEVAEAIAFKPEVGNGLDGLQHPDCRACVERKRLNLGIMEENRQLMRALAEDPARWSAEARMAVASAMAENAARKLWEAATEHWRVFEDDEDQRPLADQLFDSSVIYPGMGLKGKDLYRIGVALGFIDAEGESEEGKG